MTPTEIQWQRVKDYDHEIIRTHWDSDEPRIGDNEEGQEKFGPSLFEPYFMRDLPKVEATTEEVDNC